MEVRMSRENEWAVFEKAVELAASAVRGTAGTQPPSVVADVFREAYRALKETADAMPGRETKAGF
jgi:hypothetical protein